MAQNFTPLHDRVLLRRVAEAETVRGGILIPDTAKEKPQEGIIIAVGTGKYEKGQTIPLAVHEGDRDNDAFLGLLFCGVGDDDAAANGLRLCYSTKQNAVM